MSLAPAQLSKGLAVKKKPAPGFKGFPLEIRNDLSSRMLSCAMKKSLEIKELPGEKITTLGNKGSPREMKNEMVLKGSPRWVKDDVAIRRSPDAPPEIRGFPRQRRTAMGTKASHREIRNEMVMKGLPAWIRDDVEIRRSSDRLATVPEIKGFVKERRTALGSKGFHGEFRPLRSTSQNGRNIVHTSDRMIHRHVGIPCTSSFK